MITLTRIFTFEAAHHLPYYNGKCRKVHGHTYKLEVTIAGKVRSLSKYNPYSGMVVDFNDLKFHVEDKIIKKYDHSYLNDFLPVPTAECLIEKIAAELQEILPPDINLYEIRLWEGEKSSVRWKPDKE